MNRFATIVLSASLLASAAHANLRTNGSFEAGAFVNQGNDTMSLAPGSTVITGWTVVTDTTAWIGPANTFGLSASDGSYFLDLSNYQFGAPFAGMSQVITTTPGATYPLTFELGGSNVWGRPDAITASAAGTSVTFTTPATGTNTTGTGVDAVRRYLDVDHDPAAGRGRQNYIGLDTCRPTSSPRRSRNRALGHSWLRGLRCWAGSHDAGARRAPALSALASQRREVVLQELVLAALTSSLTCDLLSPQLHAADLSGDCLG